MKKILIIILLLLGSCVPKFIPVEPDIDQKPGRPRYTSSTSIELKKYMANEWPKSRRDTINFHIWMIIPQEGKPALLKKL